MIMHMKFSANLTGSERDIFLKTDSSLKFYMVEELLFSSLLIAVVLIVTYLVTR